MTNAQTGLHAWWDWRLLGLWILVNSLAYVVIPLAGALLEELASSTTRDLVEDRRGIAILIIAVVGAVVQGVLWGRWQWRVMRHRVPELDRDRWVLGTVVPAFAIWLLVLAPSAVDTMAEGGDTLDIFRSGFIQALVLGPLLGFGQAMALRGVTSRWAWWIVASVTTYFSGALFNDLIERWVDEGLSAPSWMAYYFPVLAFALYGVWLLWVTAPEATRRQSDAAGATAAS